MCSTHNAAVNYWDEILCYVMRSRTYDEKNSFAWETALSALSAFKRILITCL